MINALTLPFFTNFFTVKCLLFNLIEIQAVQYMVATAEVFVAATFYVLNPRMSQKNYKLDLKV